MNLLLKLTTIGIHTLKVDNSGKLALFPSTGLGRESTMQEQGFEARSETLHSEFPHDTLKLLKDHFELVCGASK